MTDHLENQILNVLALASAKPVRQLDTLQSICDTLSTDTRYGGPIDGEVAGIGIVYRN